MSSRTFLVTGANRGLGFAACAELLQGSHRLILAARTTAKAEDAAKRLLESSDSPDRVIPFSLDLCDDKSLASAPARLAEFGIDHLNGLLNNAGVFPEDQRSPLELSPESLSEVLRVNVVGTHALTRALIPLLNHSELGKDHPACIVNVSSRVASLAETSTGQLAGSKNLAYQASKAALNMLTVAWANELADSPLKINAVSPGWCATDMGGHQATRSPEQGAAALISYLFLPSSGPSGGFFDEAGEVPW